MTAEATYYDDDCEVGLVLAAAASAGEVYQLNDGRAAVCVPATGGSASDKVAFRTEGVFTVAKTASVVVLDGAPLWWDHSANTATPVPPLATGDRDFYLGCAQEDAAAAATTVKVLLNVEPSYIIDIHRDGGDTVIVKTVVGSTTVEVPNVINRGGTVDFLLGTTAEAQKVDWLSRRSFPKDSNWILEAVFNVAADADADVVDVNIGVASATAAADFEAIAEFVAFHLDMTGADFAIDAHSDDGTTDVTIVDTTKVWAVGTPVHLVIDGRDPDDCQLYVNGVLVLPDSTFTLAAGSAALKAIFHVEKTSNDSPGRVQCDMLRVRLAQQD